MKSKWNALVHIGLVRNCFGYSRGNVFHSLVYVCLHLRMFPTCFWRGFISGIPGFQWVHATCRWKPKRPGSLLNRAEFEGGFHFLKRGGKEKMKTSKQKEKREQCGQHSDSSLFYPQFWMIALWNCGVRFSWNCAITIRIVLADFCYLLTSFRQASKVTIKRS